MARSAAKVRWPCDYCPEDFATKRGVMSHMRKIHGATDETFTPAIDADNTEDYPNGDSPTEGNETMEEIVMPVSTEGLTFTTVPVSEAPKTRRTQDTKNPFYEKVLESYQDSLTADPAKRDLITFVIPGSDPDEIKSLYAQIRAAGSRVETTNTNGDGTDKGAGVTLKNWPERELDPETGRPTGPETGNTVIAFVAGDRRKRSPNKARNAAQDDGSQASRNAEGATDELEVVDA